MGNIREIYKVKDNKESEGKKQKKSYDIAGYPFGAEEMLLNAELRKLEKKSDEDLER